MQPELSPHSSSPGAASRDELLHNLEDLRFPTAASRDQQQLEEFNAKMRSAGFLRWQVENYVEFAYVMSEYAHHPQKRDGGGRYFEHPRAVAEILIDLRIQLRAEAESTADPAEKRKLLEAASYINYKQIIVGLLHDTPEDTWMLGNRGRKLFRSSGQSSLPIERGTTGQRLEIIFGYDVAKGVMQLKKIEARDYGMTKSMAKLKSAERITESRYSLVGKLADRVHNFRTLGDTHPLRQRAKLRETEQLLRDVYAPYLPDENARYLRQPTAQTLVIERLHSMLNFEMARVREELASVNWRKIAAPKAASKDPQAPFAVDEERKSMMAKFSRRREFEHEGTLINLAYDLAKYALQAADLRVDQKSAFDYTVEVTQDLINTVGKATIPSSLVVASLLANVVEHSNLFANQFDPPAKREAKAGRRLSRVFGEDASRIIVAHTKFMRDSIRPLNDQEHLEYRDRVVRAGEMSIFLKLHDRFHDMRTAVTLPPADRARKIHEIETFWLDVFEELASTKWSLRDKSALLLKGLKTQVKELKRGLPESEFEMIH